MKREIKFRGKRLDNGEWVYGKNIQFQIDGTDRVCITQKGSQRWVDPETVGQFTGLHDKNGKEIYEGDIIRFYMLKVISNDVLEEPENIIKEIISEVVYEDGAFMADDCYVGLLTEDYRVTNTDKYYFRYTANLNKFPFIKDENDLLYAEVIGNIHDNKELLTQN